MTYLDKSAILSPCGTYRYSLTRRWSSGNRVALFVMFNPSTADADTDDPTIRRCVAFARREGCDALEVVNCFAIRSPDPVLVRKWASQWIDIVGPGNREHVRRAVLRASLVVCAWGSHAVNTSPVPTIVAEADRWCLGTTKDGSPRHPLYVRADEPLTPWPRSVP